MQCHAHAKDRYVHHVLHTSGEPPTKQNGLLKCSLSLTIHSQQCKHPPPFRGAAPPKSMTYAHSQKASQCGPSVGALVQGTVNMAMCSSQLTNKPTPHVECSLLQSASITP